MTGSECKILVSNGELFEISIAKQGKLPSPVLSELAQFNPYNNNRCDNRHTDRNNGKEKHCRFS